VRELNAAWNSRDWDEFFGSLADDFELHPDPLWPEPGPYVGDEARTFLREWLEPWGTVRMEMDEIGMVGRCVVIWGSWQAEGIASGADVRLPVGLAIELNELLQPTRMHVRFEREHAVEIARATANQDGASA
jgi:hypothetical protein